MTDKELRRLNRQDLLELLLAQGRETEELNLQLETTKLELSLMKDNYEVLKQRLNDKDDHIEHLKRRLNDKDARIRDLKTALQDWQSHRTITADSIGSIAEASLQVCGVLEAAQKAANLYLYNLRRINSDLTPEETEAEFRPVNLSDPDDEKGDLYVEKSFPEKTDVKVPESKE